MIKKPKKLTCKLKGDIWYNTKSKLDWYLNNPENSIHKQVLLEGTRTNGAHWKIVCDEGIKDLMYKLNSLDYYTIYSCEGKDIGGAYILIRRPRTKKKYLQFLEILKEYFNDSILCIDDEEYTRRLTVYVWTKEQRENNLNYFKKDIKLYNSIEFGKDFK